MFHWLRSQASTAGGKGSIPGWGTKTPKAMLGGKKKKDISLFMLFLNGKHEEKERILLK